MITLLIEPNQPPVIKDTTWDEIKASLGWIEITHPFEDDNIVIINDEDGIRNQRLPNRTINECIIPSPFYICRFSSSDDLVDLTQDDIETYEEMFKTPESFGSGTWRVTTNTVGYPKKHLNILFMVSSWVPEASPTDEKEGVD